MQTGGYWAPEESTWKTPVKALGISIALHLLFFGIWQFGKQHQWWKFDTSRLLHQLIPAARRTLLAAAKPPQPGPATEIPLMFVEVDPNQAAAEPPPQAKFYSSANSIAANPEPAADLNTPKIEGNQTRVTKTFDTLRPALKPPEPAVSEKKDTEESQKKEKAKTEKEGTLQMAKVVPGTEGRSPTSNETEEKPKRQRPRTLAEAQKQKGNIQGEKMRQEGGVKRRAPSSTLDVKSTAFGAYDAKIIQAIQQRWYSLLDMQDFTRGRSGKVVLEFRLTHDGRITHMKMAESDVGELLAYLCQSSILDNVPYDPWPSDMRGLVGADYREVRFTFYYD